MGTAVAVTDGSRGMMSINLANVNYGAALAAVDKYTKSVGGGASIEKNFPGSQISFKQGQWYSGFGDTARPVKAGTQLVLNVPNAMAGWQSWGDANSGKKFPKYTPMTFPAAGDDPIERESLGDTDPEEWDTDEKGKPQDPFKPVLVFPLRKNGDETVHHMLLTTVSSCIAGFNLFRDVMEEMKSRSGQLPLVALGSDKTSMKKTETDKKGKEKKVTYTWDVPTFEVVGWVDAIDADNPSKGGVQVTSADADTDLGGVETRARKSNGKGNGKATAKSKVAPAKPVKTAKAAKAEKKVLASRGGVTTRTKTKIEDDGDAF